MNSENSLQSYQLLNAEINMELSRLKNTLQDYKNRFDVLESQV